MLHNTNFGASRRTGGRPGRPRKWAVVACLGLLVAMIPSVALGGTTPPYDIGPANAAVVPDAGLPAESEIDDDEGNVKELGPLNSNTTKIGVIHKDAVPTLGLTNPNAQVDLRRAWIHTKKDSDQDDWIYFGWERDSNTGSGFIAFEFMKNASGCDYTSNATLDDCNPWANRSGPNNSANPPQPGDFLILWDQQGGSRDLYLRTWSGTAPNLTLGAPMLLSGAVAVAHYSADGYRGEAAINITDAIFGGVQRCATFANIIPSTVTGNSDTADYKDTILEPTVPINTCSASVTTTPKQSDGTTSIPGGGISIGSGVVQVKDSAVISLTGANPDPAGSVTFWLCKLDSGTCDDSGDPGDAGVEIGTSNVDPADTDYPTTVVSPTAYVTSAGRYCWRARFSGDAGNGIGATTDSAATECFTVNAVTPTLVTTAGPDVIVGQKVTDSATLSGTATKPTANVIHTSAPSPAVAGGTITFKLFTKTQSGCGTQVGSDQVMSVSGNGEYNLPSEKQIAPGTVGVFQWVAVYSGDSPNTNGVTHNSGCDTAAEEVETQSVPSRLTTAQSWVPNDSMTVTASAGGNLSGTAYFELYESSNCAAGTQVGSTMQAAVSGSSPRTVSSSNTTAVTASGDYSWKVRYDSDNLAQDDIGWTCHETSALTITNGGTVPAP